MNGFNTANQWNKIDIIWYNENGSGKMIVYRNGANKVGGGELKPATPVMQPSGQPLVMGNFTSPTSDRAWSGELDEVRLIKGIPSAARVQADYDTVNTATFLTAGSVVPVAVDERPVANLQVVDTGASHIQFGNAISSLGSSNATECTFNVKVWKTAESEPADYTALATGLTVGALTGRVKGLTPETAYSYKIKVTNDERVDSDEVTGAFTTSGAGVGGTGGDMTRVGDDWIHYFRVGFDEHGGITNTYVFTPPTYATVVRALVVGGGGPGGYYAGGGGGAGGYYYNEALGVTPGTGYAVHVGAGGVAATSATAYGSNGGDSSIVGGNVNVVMLGGGAGGNGKLNNQTATLAGRNGGSGGGTAWAGNATGSGTEGQGHDGGDVPAGQYQQDLAAGGGGAAAVGGSVEYSASQQTKGSGTGGNGRSCDITGESLYYAGGGSGGAKLVTNNNGTGTAGAGGNGGGGKGGQYDNTEGSQYATAGADGFGGGGGGGSTYNTDSYHGGNGGNGIVIIRYAAQGDGTDVTAPAIALESLDRAADGLTTVGYRVAWAGAGYEDADVAIVWGFRKDELSHTNAIASAMIGRGTGTFTLEDQTNTVYVRALATNAGGLSSVSPKIVKIPFVDPQAPEVPPPEVSQSATKVFARKAVTLTASAPNATSYYWLKNGVMIEGGTSGTLTVNWRSPKNDPIDTYQAVAVYIIDGLPVESEASAEMTVENRPMPTVIVFRGGEPPAPPVEHDYSADYLTFRVLTPGTICWKSFGNLAKTIEYSIDNGAWTSLTSTSEGATISVAQGNLVRFRGSNTTYATDKSTYSGFEGGTATYDIEGNIMSLLYGDNFAERTTFSDGSSYNFCSLFKKAPVISAENLVLPATTLKDYCYRALFSWCSTLTKAPELPATTLATGCYWYMFEQCAITEAPVLNATTLVKECYGHMSQRPGRQARAAYLRDGSCARTFCCCRPKCRFTAI